MRYAFSSSAVRVQMSRFLDRLASADEKKTACSEALCRASPLKEEKLASQRTANKHIVT